MKGKYITTDILMAILARPVVVAEKNVLKEPTLMPDELSKVPAPVRQQRDLEREAA